MRLETSRVKESFNDFCDIRRFVQEAKKRCGESSGSRNDEPRTEYAGRSRQDFRGRVTAMIDYNNKHSDRVDDKEEEQGDRGTDRGLNSLCGKN